MRREFVPIYMITGFLESGKTTLGLTVLENERFTNGGPCLIIQCEEGEVEYDSERLEKHKGILVNLEDADELTTAKLGQLETQYRPSCVIMEYNSMWGLELLDRLRLPRLWGWAQVVTTADATTLANYMTNMRKILTDPMKTADMIYINRCGEAFDKAYWRKQIRAMNSGCSILFENTDGSVEDGVRDEDLPYDMKADIIRIADDQFGTFYLDSLEHPDRYQGRTIRIKGQATLYEPLGPGKYIFGRNAMTCCADDIRGIGFITSHTDPMPAVGQWIELTAKCEKGYSAIHDMEGVLFKQMKFKSASKPDDELVYFVNN